VSLQTGAVPEAVDSYRKALDIRERLATADPTDAQAQRDLMFSHYKLGEVQTELFAYEAAEDHYRAGIVVLDAMIAAGQNVEQSTRERDVLVSRAAAAAQAVRATGDWNDVLQQPEEELPTLLAVRCTELAKQDRIDDVAQAAGNLRLLSLDAQPGTKSNREAGLLYNAARGYGLCATGVRPDEGTDTLTDTQQTQRREFIDLSLTCLKEAIAAGWDDFEHMQQDTDLSALHDLPEFKALLPVDDQ